MADEKYIIELSHIDKSFGKQQVVKDFNLNVKRGEFVTFLGSSGCGKTTMLRMINGFETPDSGMVKINGKDQKGVAPRVRNVNTVFQNFALFPHLTVRENIAFGLQMKNTPEEEIKKKVDDMLELTQLSALENRKPSELSGGQQQRVAIARSLVNEPEVLLLDEPLGALDMKLRKKMQIDLRRIQKETGITFVYVTHDQEEALNISDRIVVMHEGRIEQDGAPWEIYHHPRTAYVASFLGESNFVEKDGTEYAIRPEYIILSAKTSGGNHISGKIRQITYFGQAERIVIAADGGQEFVSVQAPGQFMTGDTVSLSWEEENCIRLEKEHKEAS